MVILSPEKRKHLLLHIFEDCEEKNWKFFSSQSSKMCSNPLTMPPAKEHIMTEQMLIVSKGAMVQKPNKAGLEGIVAATTSVSNVDGEAGRLVYRGYDIHD